MKFITIPSVELVRSFHERLTEEFAKDNDPISPPGIKNIGLLESAVARCDTGIGDVYKYKRLFEKAAVLFHSLAKNHAFHNGNKRTALISLIYTLHVNGYYLNISDDKLYELVLGVADDKYPNGIGSRDFDGQIVYISSLIRSNSSNINSDPRELSVDDFIESCKSLGCSCRTSSGSYIISYNNSSIRISISTSRLSGKVVKRYLSTLGLSSSRNLISFDEFKERLPLSQILIGKYKHILSRLSAE